MGVTRISNAIEAKLRERLKQAALSPDFFGSWNHCSGSRKSVLCHSIGVGLLAAAIAEVAGVQQVGIDVRLRRAGNNWQPDVIGFRRGRRGELVPVVYADFESPNSSDARVPEKDLRAYRKWVQGGGRAAPYVIVVCLPKAPYGPWPLAYTTGRGYNVKHRGRGKRVRSAPLAYWRKVWHSEVARRKIDLAKIGILNVGDGEVGRVNLSPRASSRRLPPRRRL